MNGLRLVLAVALPLAVLVIGFAGFSFIKANPPEAQKRPAQRTTMVPVDATRLEPQDYAVTLRSFGSVIPRKQTTLVTQVSGVISEVSDNFQAGSTFEKGDVLLKLDASDYEIAVRGAEASLIQARANYTEEKARGDQAASDWKKLGKKGKPGALLLRTPQRQAAQAQVQSAQAQLDKAQLDLARTQILAPYAGQVLGTAVDEGRFVTTGSALGDVFASGALDVRLPLNSSQLEHMDISSIGAEDAFVELISSDGSSKVQAKLARSEGQIDVTTRQLFVVAEVSAGEELAVGQFVEARLSGRKYQDVFVVPERLVRPEGDVFLVEDGQVKRAAVELLYSDGEDAVVSGLQTGDVLVLTPLGSAVSGLRIAATIDGVEPPRSSGGGSGRPVKGEAADQKRPKRGDDSTKAARSQP